jgi:hypothetical protein
VGPRRRFSGKTEAGLTKNAINGGPWECEVKELLEMIAKALVDNPDLVQVRALQGEEVTVLELRVHPSDLGKVIGRQGRKAESIRIIGGRETAKARHGGNPRVVQSHLFHDAQIGTSWCLAKSREAPTASSTRR